MKESIWGGGKPEQGPAVKGESTPTILKEPSFLEVVENRIYFYAEIDKDSILKLTREIRNLNATLGHQATREEREPASLFLHINSYGGSVFSGLAGLDTILKSTIPVTTIVDGVSASAASFLTVAGKRRLINRHAYMMIHQISSFMWGKYEEFKDEMENLNKLMEMIKRIYREYTKVPAGKIEEILKHDIFFDAAECVKFGLVDKLL